MLRGEASKHPVKSRHESGIVTGSFPSAQDDGVKKTGPGINPGQCKRASF